MILGNRRKLVVTVHNVNHFYLFPTSGRDHICDIYYITILLYTKS